MTPFSRLLNATQPDEQYKDEAALCAPCVYFSKNLDKVEYPPLPEGTDRCGLGSLPGDETCIELRTNNCSARKRKR